MYHGFTPPIWGPLSREHTTPLVLERLGKDGLAGMFNSGSEKQQYPVC
jgi:hypothetical protein